MTYLDTYIAGDQSAAKGAAFPVRVPHSIGKKGAMQIEASPVARALKINKRTARAAWSALDVIIDTGRRKALHNYDAAHSVILSPNVSVSWDPDSTMSRAVPAVSPARDKSDMDACIYPGTGRIMGKMSFQVTYPDDSASTVLASFEDHPDLLTVMGFALETVTLKKSMDHIHGRLKQSAATPRIVTMTLDNLVGLFPVESQKAVAAYLKDPLGEAGRATDVSDGFTPIPIGRRNQSIPNEDEARAWVEGLPPAEDVSSEPVKIKKRRWFRRR